MDHCQRMKRRLEWRCRRGSKELDLILSAFMNRHLHLLSEAERQLFERLLETADPQLASWLCHGAKPADRGMSAIVERILSAGRG